MQTIRLRSSRFSTSDINSHNVRRTSEREAYQQPASLRRTPTRSCPVHPDIALTTLPQPAPVVLAHHETSMTLKLWWRSSSLLRITSKSGWSSD